MQTYIDGDYIVTVHDSGLVERVLNTGAPAVVKQWPGFEFARRFTQAETIAINTLAQTDGNAKYFVGLLDRAIASGTPIYSNDPDVAAGLAYLSATPSGNPILASGRSAQIMA